uniref:Uncharacterized protein n=1 Tax=Arundo donax TaxID=35708 RepID=A0A0A8ZY37_ARUDO
MYSYLFELTKGSIKSIPETSNISTCRLYLRGMAFLELTFPTL